MFGLALGGLVPEVAEVELEALVGLPEQRRPAGGGHPQAFEADGGLGRQNELGGLRGGVGRSHDEVIFGAD
jgi:hypothetical protein